MRSTSIMPMGGRQSHSPTTPLPSSGFASSLHQGGSTGTNMSIAAETTTNAAGATTAKRHPATPSRKAANAVESTPPTCCEVAHSPIAVPRWFGANQGLRSLTWRG